MTINQAAGSQPAAGTRVACDFNSIQSAENNMISQTTISTPGSTASADFNMVSNDAINMADALDLDIVGLPDKKFAAAKNGDVISGAFTAAGLECWLYGFFNGSQSPAHVGSAFDQPKENLGKNLPPLSSEVIKLAAHLDIDIDRRDSGYILIKDGEAFGDKFSAGEVDAFVAGYLNGKDDLEVLDAFDSVERLLGELVKAEQVIQAMMAAMGDAQKQAASNSLISLGAAGKQSACRSVERQAAIAAVRPFDTEAAA